VNRYSKLALEDRLLLTLYYIRHYPTFINLAAIFDISESYCHKIYARTARVLAKVEKLPSRKALLENPSAIVAIDVSEQPIERPVKNQKAYFSGKKTPYNQSPSRDLSINADYPVRSGG
jgi:Helix-turn-helix of DDE superfamily endonuclease